MKTNITFLVISRSFLLRIRNVPDKSCRENQNTHFISSNSFSKIVPFIRQYGKYCRSEQSQMKIWRMCVACRIPKATNIHSECVTPIAFPRQQWLPERTSKVCYTYVSRPVHLGNGRSFRPRLLYPRGESSQYPLKWRPSGFHELYRRFGEDKPSHHKVTKGRI